MAYCIKGKGVVNVMLGDRIIKLDSDSEINIYPSTQSREAQNDGEFTIRDRSPSISGTFRVPSDMRVQEIIEAACTRVIVEMYDGRVFVLENASQVGENDYQGRAGVIDLEFIGERIEERLPA